MQLDKQGYRFQKLFIVFMVVSCNLHAQLGIGEWRTHLPYQFTNQVMVTKEKAYCSSTGGLFSYDLEDNSIETISKTEGLSDNGVRFMAWSEENDLVLLAYENANIDIVAGNEIINIPDIMKKPIPGDKTIYHIFFLGEKAYLSCGFGIVVFDLKEFEITETYFIGDNGNQLKVNQITSDGTYLFAATDQGIRRAELGNPFLIDFNSWELMEGLPSPSESYKGVEFFSGSIFAVFHDDAGQRDIIYRYIENWNEFGRFPDSICNEIRTEQDYLVLTGNEGVYLLSDDLLIVRSYLKGSPRSATIDENGELWVADYGRGMVRVEGEEEQLIRPNGPFSPIAYNMASSDGILYTVSGGVNATYNNLFRSAILQVFNDERWLSRINYEELDLVSIVIDPDDPNHVFAASWGYGLLEYLDNQLIEVYNESNSSLQNAVPVGDVIRIGGLTFDEEGNLWMTNTGVAEPISVLKTDGTWKSFKADGILTSYNALGEIMFTQDGHLWGIIPRGGGLFAIDFNNTLDNEEDDEYLLVNVVDENNRVITNDIYSFAEDLNGNIWLGTNQGILVFYNPGSIFENGNLFAREIIVPRNDGSPFGDPLLQTQVVSAIEVDGSNRKWLGTAGGGAFLVSENGFEQIHDFNIGNSPILSNSIIDICIEGESGEVYFGTEKGLISYKGEATIGNSSYDNVVVYPNPVRETYNGPIAISGLVSESVVKITDISGNLVKELESFGGQAIWDGTNFRGDRVATGTYLIFLVDRNLTDAHVAKILFIH